MRRVFDEKICSAVDRMNKIKSAQSPMTMADREKLEKILSENGWEAKAIIGAWYDR